LIYVVRNP